MKRKNLIIIVIAGLLAILFFYPRKIILAGSAMGTTYHITIFVPPFTDINKVKSKIDDTLQKIDQTMSVFNPDSELSRLNNHISRKPIKVSQDLYQLLVLSRRVYKLTDGYWDATAKPLIDLWCFGNTKEILLNTPTKKQIIDLRKSVSFDSLVIMPQQRVKKNIANLSLDLSSIAKGFAVDKISELLNKKNIKHYIVEIGGELYLSVRSGKRKWSIGIAFPNKDKKSIYKTLYIEKKGIATSGDYQNYYKLKNKTYTHIINPKTGYPIISNIISATVIAPSCAFADGLATAFMIMSPTQSIAVLDSLENIDGLILQKTDQDQVIEFSSKGLYALVEN